MEHPQALATAGKSGPVVLFARNRLCALARPGLAVEPATLLDRMLDANVKLGTSTPRADPSGDYAWEVFRKADRLTRGFSKGPFQRSIKQAVTGAYRCEAADGEQSLTATAAGRHRAIRTNFGRSTP